MLTIFQLLVFLFSIIVHEISHGLMALRLGDTTAKDAGRLTLNPVAHLELFGSFLLPLMFYLASGGSMIFGWAKPVPFNPLRLKNPWRDSGLIGAAGPLSNFFIAALFAALIRIMDGLGGAALSPLIVLFQVIVATNVLIAVFNLVPIPPLDGSKVLFAILPKRYYWLLFELERYSSLVLLFFVFFGFSFIAPIIGSIYFWLVGGA